MNEDLRQYALRVKDFLGSRSWNLQCVSILLLAILLLGVLVLAARDPAETSYEPLFPDRVLNPTELQKIAIALGDAELDDYLLRDGQLHVLSHKRPQYFLAVAQADCWPQSFHDAANESSQNRNLLELGPQREERQQDAREKKLRLAIREIPGVENVSVLFDETSPRGFSAERAITAQVNVTTPDGRPLNLDAVRTIHHMVLHFKAGLKPENILITDLKAGRPYRGSGLPEAGSVAARSMLQSNLERQWRERLSSVLSFVPNARVAIHVRLGEASTLDETSEVRVSVGVPTSYLNRIRDTRRSRLLGSDEPVPSLEQLEQQTREKIQAVVGLHLPGTPDDAEVQRLVIVTSFDDLASLPSLARPDGAPAFPSPAWILLAGILVGMGGAIYVWRTQRLGIPKKEPGFKVVPDAAEVPESSTARDAKTTDGELRERLQLLVDEDPEAAARSLADWIDKAS